MLLQSWDKAQGGAHDHETPCEEGELLVKDGHHQARWGESMVVDGWSTW